LIASRAAQESVLSVAGLEQVDALVRARLGIEIRHPERGDDRARLERVLQASGCTDWWQLFGRLQSETMTDAAWVAIINHVTVGETYFFRHEAQFAHLRHDILEPLILERRQASAPWLRLWSAACSTGEEAYSLAILVRELVPDWRRWNILVLATDVNSNAVAGAITGRYGNWSFREPMHGMKESCFTSHGDRFVVNEDVRRMVTFATHNLLDEIKEGWASSFDVILCRNVLLYFSAAGARMAAGHLHDALRPGASLIVGPSDPWAALLRDFEQIRADQATSFRRPAGEVLVPPGQPRSERHPVHPGANPKRERASPRANQPAPPPLLHDAVSCLHNARVAADAGQHDAAIDWCLRARDLEPVSAQAYFLLGSIHSEQQDHDRAVDMLRKAVYLEPNFAAAHYSLGQQLHLNGDMPGARRSIRTANRLRDAIPTADAEPAGA